MQLNAKLSSLIIPLRFANAAVFFVDDFVERYVDECTIVMQPPFVSLDKCTNIDDKFWIVHAKDASFEHFIITGEIKAKRSGSDV